jgi:hypothetical protein
VNVEDELRLGIDNAGDSPKRAALVAALASVESNRKIHYVAIRPGLWEAS